jgi:hypothetical protein
MNRKLVMYFLFLELFVIFITTLTVAIGRLRPSVVQSIFTAPDGTFCGRRCLFGVYPGRSMEADAINLLRTHPLLRDFDLVSLHPFRIEGHNDWIMMVSFNTTPDGLVDEITIARYIRYGNRPAGEVPVALPEVGTLGDALSLFGSPDFVQLTTGGDPSLVFTDAGAITNLVRTRGQPGRIALQQPVSRLTLFRPVACDSAAYQFTFLPWLGVTQLRRYAFTYGIKRTVRSMNSASSTFAPCQH